MLVNHFKMRDDIQSYALGGMGCANGVIGVNMICDLLQVRLNETISLDYEGKLLSKMSEWA